MTLNQLEEDIKVVESIGLELERQAKLEEAAARQRKISGETPTSSRRRRVKFMRLRRSDF